MQRSLKLAFALALAVTAGCATADEPIVPDQPEPEQPAQEEGPRWITIGTDALVTAQMALDERHRNRILTPVKMGRQAAVLSFNAEDFGALSELMHERHNRCGGFMVHETLEEAEAAVNGQISSVAPLVTYTIDNPGTVNGMISEIQESRIRAFITSLSSFTTRYYTSATGVQSSDFIFNQWTQIAAGRSDITVQRFTHTWAQSSIILTIPGTSLPNEVVVIGGHQDSIQSGNVTGLAPGADDDASGIATITEVLRAVVAKDYRPARTVKLMAYAAEEVGLRGSAAIAADHLSRNVNVVGVVQFDMTLFKGSAQDIYLMTDRDYTNEAQNTFVGTLIDTYTGATRGTGTCGYACSDHASWNTRGFPASMPFEATLSQSNPRIHTTGDTLANSGGTANHAVKFAKLGVAFLGELAKGTIAGGANTAPTVTITAPGNGATVGTTVTLTGAANDNQDGNLSSSIRWSSNVAGNLGTGTSVSATLALGAHTLTAAVTDSGGLTTSTSVNVTVASAAFSDNFEGTLAWTLAGTTNQWHKVTSSTCASPGYSSPVSSLYFGRDATCTYANGTSRVSGTATSPSFSGLTSAARLSFKYFRRVESGSGNWDVASVAVVVGSTATTVWTRNASNASTTTWQDSGLISLAQFAGQTVQLRLSFDSMDGTANNFTGWLVDDVVVTR